MKLLKNKLLIGLIVFLVIYTGCLFYLAKNSVTWEDEMFTLHTTSGNLWYATTGAYTIEGQPPVYFSLLQLWRNFDESLFFARLFSVIFTLLSGLIIYKLCRIFLNEESSILIIVLFFLNPYVVEISFDARPYSLVLFLSSISIYLFFKAYLIESPSKIIIGFHTFISLLGSFTQYLFVFVLIAQAVVLLQRKEWKRFRLFFVIHLFIALIFAVNLIFLSSQAAHQKSPDVKDLQYFIAFFSSARNFLFAFNYYNFKNVIENCIVFLYIIWLFASIKKQGLSIKALSEIKNPAASLLTITVIIFFSIMFLFSIVGVYYSSRYMTIIFPSLFIIFIFSLTFYGRKYFLFWFMFLFVFYLFTDINIHSRLVHNLDYKKTADYIERNVKSDVPLLFYRHAHSLPFQVYFNGKNKIMPLPFPLEFDNHIKSDEDYIIKDTITLNKIFKKDLKNEKELLLITEINRIISRRFNYEMVDKYLLNIYNIQSDTVIIGMVKNDGLRIRKLIKKTLSDIPGKPD